MNLQWQAWQPGKLLAINRIQWDQAEVDAVLDVFKRDYFAQWYYVKAFQEALTRLLGDSTVVLNSGSSALDVSIKSLLSAGLLKVGDKVLHPSLTFNTSATCIVNNGLIPVFVDAAEGTYNLDATLAQEAIEKYSPKLTVLPYILGNTTNLDVLLPQLVADKIFLIGDSCDTLGTEWAGKEVSYYSDFTAYSFYGSHHISTAGVGGALRVKSPVLYNLAHSLVYWGRNFESTYRYDYITLGGDSQMTEFQAAFGVEQLKRLPAFNQSRREVFSKLYAFMQQYEEYFILPYSYAQCNPSWFGFPLTIRDGSPFSRADLTQTFEEAHIEWRPLFSGNTVRQQAWKSVNFIHKDSPVADKCYSDSFFLPAWGMPDDAFQFECETIERAIKKTL